MLRGDSSGSALVAAVDEKIHRALADAVERHATKDPRPRGILKRRKRCLSSRVRASEERRAGHSRTCHHSLQSSTEDHQGQAHDPATPQART